MRPKQRMEWLLALTPQQFQKFFEAKKLGTYKCPFCAQENFVGNGYDASNVAIFQFAPPGPFGRHDFISLSCTNCGHTDLFHMAQVQRWLDEQTAAK